jgi:hypothetical protein
LRADPRLGGMTMQRFLLILTYFVGMVAITLTGILGYEGYRAMKRVDTELADLKANVAVLSGNIGAQQPATISDQSVDQQKLLELSNRIAILEQTARGAPVSSTTLLPPIDSTDAAGPVATGDDCIPAGTEFLAQADQTTPICGTTIRVTVAAIAESTVLLAEGGTVLQTVQTPIQGTSCTIMLTKPPEGGFANLKVTC